MTRTSTSAPEVRRVINAQLIHEAQRKCNGATRHAVDQIILSLPYLIATYNHPKCKDRDEVCAKIDDLERTLWALAHRN